VIRPIQPAPSDIITRAAVEQLQQAGWDAWLEDSEGGEVVIAVRHFHGAYADVSERPALLVRLDGDEIQEGDFSGGYGVYGEVRRQCQLSMIIDVDVPEESEDPSGFGLITAMATAAICVLKSAIGPDGAGPLREWAEDVIDGGLQPDEDSSSDEGRMAQVAMVVYRVAEEDRFRILPNGVNA
jgi:hypothetical protein